ncbi:MAG: alpha/beta-hydrolase family protein [Pirellulales bacterium]
MVRFTGREDSINAAGDRWGPMRYVYIQHASDPMIFFSPDLAYHQPDWLVGERGPDVSPYLRWYPLVTFLQCAFDLPMATSVPSGYGHNYDAASYIDGWVAVTAPNDWDAADSSRLKEHFSTPQSAGD